MYLTFPWFYQFVDLSRDVVVPVFPVLPMQVIKKSVRV